MAAYRKYPFCVFMAIKTFKIYCNGLDIFGRYKYTSVII